MTVLKFGGTSLANATRIRNAGQIAQQAVSERGAKAIVCSALGGVTNSLIQMAEAAARGDMDYREDLQQLRERHRETSAALVEGSLFIQLQNQLDACFEELAELLEQIVARQYLDRQLQDHIMGFGERCSAQMMAVHLSQFLPTHYVDARNIIRTDDRFGHAQVKQQETDALVQDWFEKHTSLAIVTGFIASSPKGIGTTLGRGGSDYTAALLGAALGCDHIEIWTDVNGFMTADPNQVPAAFSPRNLTFEDALELAYLGAKVIYPPTLIPAMNADVAVLVKNCFLPEHPGTLIENDTLEPVSPITGISAIQSIVEIQVTSQLGRHPEVFQAKIQAILQKATIPIHLLSLVENQCRLFIDERQDAWQAVWQAIAEEFRQPEDRVMLHREVSLIALVGRGLGNPLTYEKLIRSALAEEHIEVLAYGQCRSARNISLIVPRLHQQQTQCLLHEVFFPNKDQNQPVTV